MNENINVKNRSIDDVMTGEFQDFILEEGFVGEEIKQAYLVLLGVSDLDESAGDRVQQIYEKMKEMIEQKYPMNRFIEFAEISITAVDDFKQSVAELNVTDKEKATLNSIVDNNRAGEIEVILDGKTYFTITVKENGSKERLALELNLQLCSKILDVSDQEVSIWFEEGTE